MPYTPYIWVDGPQGVWPIPAARLNNLETGVQQALAAGGGGSVDWASITGKPATFTPSPHTHDYATEITGKPATFAPSPHSHDWATEITGKPATFTPSAHQHTIADIIASGTRDTSTFLRGDGTFAIPTATASDVVKYLAADQAVTQPAADLTGLFVDVTVGDRWEINLEAQVAAASGTATGINYQLAVFGGATIVTPNNLNAIGGINAATAVLNNSLSTATATTVGFNKSTTRGWVRVRWFISVGASGQIRIQHGSTSASVSMTTFAGAVMRARKVN